MKWIKRLTLLLAGLLLSLMLVFAGALLFLDEADYKRVLAWSTDNFLDSELVISGPLSIGYSEGILFSAEGVQLQAHDGSYSLETGTVSTNFYLRSIFSGALWIHDLTLDEFTLKITEPEDEVESFVFTMPPVVIARGRVSKLLVEYQEASPGTLHSFSLDTLQIDDVNDEGPVTIQANGQFEGKDFKLDGTLPPLESIQAGGVPKPVKITFDSEKTTASLEGNIADLANGKGMDLALKISAQEMHKYLEIFADGIPALGKLDATATLRGDYSAPRLDDIDLHMQRGDGVNFTARGSIADITTGEGSDLQIEGQSNNPAVLSWALFKHQDRLSSVKLKLGLRQKGSRYLIDKLDANAVTPEGLKIALSGSGEIYAAGHKFKKSDAGFTVKVSAPKTSAFNVLGHTDYPDFGSVSGSAALAVGFDAVGLYGMDVNIGSRDGSHASLAGDIGYIPLNNDLNPANTDLKVSLHTTDFERLGKQLGYEWPNMGEAGLSGDLGIKKTELRLDNARLNMGNPQQPTIKANGSLATELNKGSTVGLEFDVAVTDLVAAFTGNTPGYLGRLQGNIDISDKDGRWGIEKIDLASSQTSMYQVNVSGSFDDLVTFDEGNLKLSLAVNDMAAMGDALGMDLSAYGAYQGEGTLTSSKGKLSYRGSDRLGNSISTTELDGILIDGKPHFTGKFNLPVLYLDDIGLSGKSVAPTDETLEVTPGSGYVFSREPLDTAFLNKFNLEFGLAIDQVKGKELAFDRLKAQVSVKDGHLTVSPFHMDFEGGLADIYLDVQDGEIPGYQFKITTDDLKLGSMLAQVQNEVPLRGYSNIQMDLRATGRSPYELISSLDGTASIGLENIRIPKKYVDLLSVDVLGWVASKSIARESYINLNCVVMSFVSKDGLVSSQAIIADGPRLSLGGRINIDLGEETLDIVLIPKQKRRVFSSISPVKIHGPMNNPVVDAIPAKAAVAEMGSMALPSVFISVKAIEKLWGLLDDGDKVGEGCAGLEKLDEAAEKEMKKESK